MKSSSIKKSVFTLFSILSIQYINPHFILHALISIDMQKSSLLILAATVFVILLVIIYGWYIMWLSATNIFRGSGKPISMAKVVLSSVHITAQILFGVLVIGIVSVMMLEGKITPDAGLPVISGIVGYLLGKSFKDVYENSPAKSKFSENQDQNK
jgi:hypothetical protein